MSILWISYRSFKGYVTINLLLTYFVEVKGEVTIKKSTRRPVENTTLNLQ